MSMLFGEDPSVTVLAAALAVDVLWGEPPSVLHPVVWMGKVASWLEKLAPRNGVIRQLVAGAFIALVLPSSFAGASLLVSDLRAWPVVWFVVSVLLLKSTFAVRGLGRAAFEVRGALARGSLSDARQALRSLCSRDPSKLDEPLLVAATIESLAENASDSFVAPLFYYALFGLPGALFYRAVNTLDAMIGYHGRYEYLGKASARLDDSLNFIPARATSGLLVVAGWLCRNDARNGWAIWKRDGRKTESPNAGRPMAAIAGLLRVQLEKVGHYRLGDPAEALGVRKIDDAWRIVMLGAGIGAGMVALALGVRHACAQ
jgi:adenosylcobinamide-phosphate synthase